MRFSSLALLAGLALSAAAQETPFERHFTIPGALEIQGATRDADGNFYIANETAEGDIQVTCISPTGDHQWTRAYPFFTEDGLYGNSIGVGPEGLVLCGYTMGSVTASRDGVILHIGLDGTLISSTRIDVDGGSNALHFMTRTNDGFIASGRGPGAGSYDMLLAKLDDSGNMLWSKTYGTTGWDWGYQPRQLADGGFALIGYGDGLGTGYSPSGYLVRTDALGNEMWARSISSGSGVDEAYTVVESTTGDLYVGGRSLGFITGDVTAYITKISSTGSHLWTRKLQNGIEAWELHPTSNGGVAWLVHPQYIPGGGGDYDIAYGTFDADGNVLTSNMYGGPASDNGMVFFQNDDGGYSIIGMSNPSLTADFTGLLLVTDANGDVDCNNIDLALNWTPATAIVAPFTSTTGSGFSAFPYTLGEAVVAVGSSNPCCNEEAAFTMEPQTDPFSWEFIDASTGANSYLWDFGDGSTSTEASPTHTYAANGNYTVCLTITGDCGEATACQQVEITVGLDELGGASGAPSLFPSPATDLFVVRAPGAPIKQVQLFDANGRAVALDDLSNTGAQVVVPVAQLPAGTYTARILLADGTIHHRRALVAH